jgi:helix-turn-helix protein
MFNTDIIKQFDMTREILMKSIQFVTESDAESMPNGFNNTIKWHIGHILYATNRTFTIFKSSSYLPEHYIDLFKPGTSPRDWTNDIPTLKELFEKLEQQKVMIRDVFSDCMDQKLETPFRVKAYGGHEFLSVGEMLNFFIFHEAMHIGYINAFKRLIHAKG